MSKDIRGYYALLEVQHDATAHEIKSAYRRLAKIHHPDVQTCTDGGLKFRKITEGYEVLCDPDARAVYDSEGFNASGKNKSEDEFKTIEPIVCSLCRAVTAQPRYIVFRNVVSVVFATYRNATQGIYCSKCANRAAWKANLIAALAGWWGVPWGPVYAVSEGVRNALGGRTDPDNNEKMLWHNALAFASHGDVKLAFALAKRVARSKNVTSADRAEDFLKFLKSRGVDYGDVTLSDPWRKEKISSIGQFLLVAFVPVVFAMAIIAHDSGNSSTGAAVNVPPSLSPLPTAAASYVNAQSDADANLPTCRRKIGNGERLDGLMKLKKSGHVLTIMNGSGGDAIIKMRKLSSKKLAISFLVSNSETAKISGIPDGEYYIQYAFGEKLAAGCKSFTKMTAAGQFPQVDELKSTFEDVPDGVMVTHRSLSYTLYSVPAGNVSPQEINSQTFDAE